MGKGDTLLNAVIGAVVTVVLSFVGVSPLLGGGVAGYLQQERRKRGAVVGALSGALATLPLVLLLIGGVVLVGVTGLPGGPELLVILLLVFPLLLAWNVGLGALGGYLGVVVREEM